MATYKQLSLLTPIEKGDVLHKWDNENKEVMYKPVPNWYVSKTLSEWGTNTPTIFRLVPNSVKFIVED